MKFLLIFKKAPEKAEKARLTAAIDAIYPLRQAHGRFQGDFRRRSHVH